MDQRCQFGSHLGHVAGVRVCFCESCAEQAAKHLGVGRTTVYRLINTGELPSITIGRCRRIPLERIAAFVARRLRDADQPV